MSHAKVPHRCAFVLFFTPAVERNISLARRSCFIQRTFRRNFLGTIKFDLREFQRTVMRSLRKSLADSHVSAVAIAVLLFWSIEMGLRSLWGPLYRTASFLFTAVAILDIPYVAWDATHVRYVLFTSLWYFFYALVSFCSAWHLSLWVYGTGPLRSLSECRTRLARRDRA